MQSNDLTIAIEAAQAAAQVIRSRFRTSVSAEAKTGDAGGDKGIVTEVDALAESAIISVLQSRSRYPILGEECGSIGEAESTSGFRWVVDPLDGTTNFARQVPLFAVSVALVEGFAVRLGVIVDPISGDVYAAEVGHGAFLNHLPLTSVSAIGSPAIFINHGYAKDDRLRSAEITKCLVADWTIRKLGTTALELCLVARGSVDAFVCSGDEFWDFAAGLVIASEAGCLVKDWRGNAWDGSTTELLVCRAEVERSLLVCLSDLSSENF